MLSRMWGLNPPSCSSSPACFAARGEHDHRSRKRRIFIQIKRINFYKKMTHTIPYMACQEFLRTQIPIDTALEIEQINLCGHFFLRGAKAWTIN
jgi:hypothetical protein